MDKLLEVFEASLAEYKASVGKTDNLVGTGQIIVAEMRKQRDQIVTLGRLLADFYAAQNNGPAEARPAAEAVLRLNDFRRERTPHFNSDLATTTPTSPST